VTLRKRTAILISGRGSNMAALIAAAADPAYPAEIAVVVSNRAAAAGLERAAEAGIATAAVSYKEGIAAGEAAIETALAAHGVDLVCLAGFMRLLSPGFVARWRDRMINIHPSLLPAFPGLDSHERALAAGVKLHGCTVHFVRSEMDSGPIIGQAAVPVLPADTPETLAARVLAAEHVLYPKALAVVASGRVRVEDEHCLFDAPATDAAGLMLMSIGLG
jgi:phosphoribosylglycinamide formyltransferase-1